MGDGPPGFPQDSTCPAVLRCLPRDRFHFAYGAFTPYGRSFQIVRLQIGLVTLRRTRSPSWQVLQPRPYNACALAYDRFRLFPFRSPLLRESRFLSLPRGTEMYQFPRFASRSYVFTPGCPDMTPGGFPHSDIPGSKPVYRLPEAFRRLPRPSSPPGAKASTTCPL